MGRKEVLQKRKELEKFYYGCKLKTPEDVAELFKTYTYLIWNHHQAGLVYDYYSDETTLNHEGTFKEVGGVTVTEQHTIPSLAAFPSNGYGSFEIFCVGNEKDGYRFGQVTSSNGVFPENTFCGKGLGTGLEFQEGDSYTFCQCVIKKVNGRWVVAEEYLVFGEEVSRRRVAGARPFFQTILDDIQGPPDECCCGCEDFDVFDMEEEG